MPVNWLASLSRPEFRAGQPLRAADLRAESEERLESAQRHQAHQHLAGIVAGLWLENSESTGTCVSIHITPGMAVDAVGRAILISASRKVEIARTDLPVEIWIAHSVTPADRRTPPEPDRYLESCEVLLLTLGRLDPVGPGEHSRCPVYLGSVHKAADDSPVVFQEGRIYVGAVAGRVEGASRRARLLLGPDGPGDLRLFAISTRASDDKPYTDHLNIDATSTVNILSPTSVRAVKKVTKANPSSNSAMVQVGGRAVDILCNDICRPINLARSLLENTRDAVSVWLNRQFPSQDKELLTRLVFHAETAPQAALRVGILLTRVLNQVIQNKDEQILSSLLNAVQGAGVILRPQTSILLREQIANSTRADPFRLRRLLLEDSFPDDLAQLPHVPAEPRGISFKGTRSAPTTALPSTAYFASVTEKGKSYRELRIELKNPGKDNYPDRYKVVFGVAKPPVAGETKTSFEPRMSVDASRTVTIAKDLKVFTVYTDTRADDDQDQSQIGFILRQKPDVSTLSPAEARADALSQVGSEDLIIVVEAVNRKRGSLTLTIRLRNDGEASIFGIQVHVVITREGQPLIHKALIRDLTVKEHASVLLQQKNAKEGDPIIIPVEDDNVTVTRPLTLRITALGIGPGNNFIEAKWEQVVDPLSPGPIV